MSHLIPSANALKYSIFIHFATMKYESSDQNPIQLFAQIKFERIQVGDCDRLLMGST
jgi:hypothetical protein